MDSATIKNLIEDINVFVAQGQTVPAETLRNVIVALEFLNRIKNSLGAEVAKINHEHINSHEGTHSRFPVNHLHAQRGILLDALLAKEVECEQLRAHVSGVDRLYANPDYELHRKTLEILEQRFAEIEQERNEFIRRLTEMRREVKHLRILISELEQ